MSKPPGRTEGLTAAGRVQGASVTVGGHDSRGVSPSGDMRVGDRGGRQGDRPDGAPLEDGVRLDAAIDTLLAADELDPVSRVRLKEARRAISDGGRMSASAAAEGATLSRALFQAVMPRLRNPDVLRAERHRTLLERLASDLTEASEDGVVRAGTLVVHRELKRLTMLRTRRNALVKG